MHTGIQVLETVERCAKQRDTGGSGWEQKPVSLCYGVCKNHEVHKNMK